MTQAVVLLDWHRTLSHSLFWGHWSGSQDAARREAATRLADACFGGDGTVLASWTRGDMTAEAVIAAVAASAGVDPLLALDGLAESCAQMEFASPGILPLVGRLRAGGVRVGIATDNMDTFMRWTVPAMELRDAFDPILSSAELRALKAGPLDATGESPFFGALLADLAPGTHVYLVDDGADTAPVAEAVGIAFCHVTPERDVVAWLEMLAAELLPTRVS
ncbi:MAG: HAD family hydrolase [Thermomicrobiales bacterium]